MEKGFKKVYVEGKDPPFYVERGDIVIVILFPARHLSRWYK